MDLLAINLRPKNIKEIIGQEHLVKEGRIIYNLVKNKKLFSMILYGNPGIGKTSIANAITEELGIRHRFLNAVINNKKDFDIVVEEAKMYGNLVVIMDEIHRLNKDKQDLLLPYLENGIITLIGLTSSNPYNKINLAIRSRCQIFELKPLSSENIKEGLKRGVAYLSDLTITDEAIDYIVSLANYDLRFAYNLLEMAYYASDKNIDLEFIRTISNKPVYLSDSNEDNHFDMLSAFQKSIRRSDVNASIYYLARLIEQDDFDSIYRRMTVISYEDIGLANPGIHVKVDAAIRSCERVGMPEARIILSEIIIEMALSPKSNSAYLALASAMEDIESGKSYPIPKHIKNHSRDYLYPHDFPFAQVKQQYLPDKLKDKKYYYPKDNNNELIYKKIIENLKK